MTTHIKIRFGKDLSMIDAEFRKQMTEMFRLTNPYVVTGSRGWRPQADICECTDEILVVVELAGVKLEDLQIELARRALKISGWRREVPRKENIGYRLAEISYGYFERTLPLPVPVDTESAMATYAEGMLQILLRKRREMPRKIVVRNV
jgi:HSP20 family protein